jgi:hypothetical protein
VRGRVLCLLALSLLAAWLVAPARAAAAPLYDVRATWGDTNLPPGGEGQFQIQVRNIGAEDGKGPMTVTDQLPAGVTATHIASPYVSFGEPFECTGIGEEEVECTLSEFWVSEFKGHGLAQAPGMKTADVVGLFPTGYLPTVFIDVAIASDASGTGTNTATVSGGGAVGGAADEDQVPFGATPSGFGLVPGSLLADNYDAEYPFGSPTRLASDRPFELRFDFDLNVGAHEGSDATRYTATHELVKTIEPTLPRGMIGNPEATPKCDAVDFSQTGASFASTGCPANTQVGYLNVASTFGKIRYGAGPLFTIANEVISHIPIYNLVPPKGKVADLGINATYVQAHIYPTPDAAHEYAITSLVPNISSLANVHGQETTIWGVPGDPAHDRFRYYPKVQANGDVTGAPFVGVPIRPFLTNPMDCGFDNGGAQVRAESYQHPGSFTAAEEYPQAMNVEGCGDPRFRFEPDVSLQPTDSHAGAPTGLDVHLEVPQRDDEVEEAKELYAANGFPKAIATPPIKRVVVTLPEGMTLSTSAAQGLGSCSPEQIGLGASTPVRCPDSSQYGRLILHTPLLPANAQPEGFIYIAKQNDNFFHNFLSLYLVIQDPQRGLLIKIPGRIDLDPKTGQITTTFDNLPQLPISDMQMTFKGGVRAGLVNPSTCGRKTIEAEFFSWQSPTVAHRRESSYEVTERPNGSPCPGNLAQRPFAPAFSAGTASNAAGAYSPLSIRITRTDEDQEFSQLGLTFPQGLTGKLAGVAMCSEVGIAQALARTGAGEGALEQANSSCPSSAQIGSTDVGLGVGVPLTYVSGKVYLAGPYRGAPLSIVVISPALAGPYDLGVVTVRTALQVDPTTAQPIAVSDPFPLIYQGIPVRIRDIRINLDRPGFVLNPTSCAQKQIAAHLTGTGGDLSSTADDTAADLSERFQAADCGALGFKPKLSFRLFGATRRGGHPRLKAFLKPRPGDANFAAASVALPRSEFLDQGHIKTVCTRVQFAAHACSSGSIYGHAIARTPLFDTPLEGPVYLRSSSHQLPDVVAALRGPDSQPIEVDVVGRVDSINGGIRTTFEFVPDAPVSSFLFTLQGDKKGLLINSTNLCAKVNRATAKFTAQNRRKVVLHPVLKVPCPKRASKRR